MFNKSPNGVGNSYYQDNEDETLSEIKDLKLIISQGNFLENNLSLEEKLLKEEELKEKREMGALSKN